uniref:Uncharacterized protein n=1 Tax=Piliocolobus tephrosceles TaxID=591936 RepID=A0A8C9HRF3_9PRIM
MGAGPQHATLQAYPEAGTVEGLASLLVALLEETTWVDRVHILQVLLRLLPNISSDLQGQLQGLLIYLLNLDQPPSLQDQTQKKFVMLALQLLLACSLESRDVVLELMSYFLYSPVRCRPELKKLLHGLGLQDPEGFLFQEMMTWVQSPNLDSKAGLRTRCCQKLEDMIQQLQVGLVGAGGALGTLLPSLAFYKSWDQNQLRPRAPCLAQSWVSSLPALNISGDFPAQVEVNTGCLALGVEPETALGPPCQGRGSPCLELRVGLQWPWGCSRSQGAWPWVTSPQMESSQPLSSATLLVVLPKVSKTSALSSPPKETPSQTSVVSGAPTRASVIPWGTSWSPSSVSGRLSQVSEVPLMVVSPAEPPSLSPELQAQRTLAATRSWGTRQLRLRVLSETLKSFCLEPEAGLGPAGPAQLPEEPPLLEETDWSHSQLLDLGPIDALNFFCQQLRARRQQARQQSSLQEEAAHPHPPVPDTVAPVPDMVVPPPREHWCHPILRLQEAKAQRSARSAMRLRGCRLLWRALGCAGRAGMRPEPTVAAEGGSRRPGGGGRHGHQRCWRGGRPRAEETHSGAPSARH